MCSVREVSGLRGGPGAAVTVSLAEGGWTRTGAMAHGRTGTWAGDTSGGQWLIWQEPRFCQWGGLGPSCVDPGQLAGVDSGPATLSARVAEVPEKGGERAGDPAGQCFLAAVCGRGRVGWAPCCCSGAVGRAGGLGGPGAFFSTGRQGWPGSLRTWGCSWGGARCRPRAAASPAASSHHSGAWLSAHVWFGISTTGPGLPRALAARRWDKHWRGSVHTRSLQLQAEWTRERRVLRSGWAGTRGEAVARPVGARARACEGSHRASLTFHSPGLNPGSIPFTPGGLTSPVQVGSQWGPHRHGVT